MRDAPSRDSAAQGPLAAATRAGRRGRRCSASGTAARKSRSSRSASAVCPSSRSLRMRSDPCVRVARLRLRLLADHRLRQRLRGRSRAPRRALAQLAGVPLRSCSIGDRRSRRRRGTALGEGVLAAQRTGAAGRRRRGARRGRCRVAHRPPACCAQARRRRQGSRRAAALAGGRGERRPVAPRTARAARQRAPATRPRAAAVRGVPGGGRSRGRRGSSGAGAVALRQVRWGRHCPLRRFALAGRQALRCGSADSGDVVAAAAGALRARRRRDGVGRRVPSAAARVAPEADAASRPAASCRRPGRAGAVASGVAGAAADGGASFACGALPGTSSVLSGGGLQDADHHRPDRRGGGQRHPPALRARRLARAWRGPLPTARCAAARIAASSAGGGVSRECARQARREVGPRPVRCICHASRSGPSMLRSLVSA